MRYHVERHTGQYKNFKKEEAKRRSILGHVRLCGRNMEARNRGIASGPVGFQMYHFLS